METHLYIIGANKRQLDLFNDEYFDLVFADGLTGIDMSIGSATIAGVDGDIINSKQAQARMLTLDLRVKNNIDVELCKRHVMQVVKVDQRATLRFIQGERDMTIEGDIRAISLPRFSNECTIQISFHCARGFWEDAQKMKLDIARYLPAHHFKLAFPRAIPLGIIDSNMTRTYTNEGDTSCGMIITITALAECSNPTIWNSRGEFIGVVDSMQARDVIEISTIRGEKYIKKNGENILSKMKKGSSFIQMETGDNEFTITTEEGLEGSAYFSLEYRRRFI